MIKGTFKYRVRYADTDQAGIVYYGNYAKFYEIGRTELIRDFGLTYKELEDMGIIMPVVSMNVKYIKPVLYDELISIETTVEKITGARAIFHSDIYNSEGELVNSADVILTFIDRETRRIIRAPEELTKVLEENLKDNQHIILTTFATI